jgi:transcriptional regulator with XRE-family HTH domain
MNMMDDSIKRMQQHLGLLRMCMGMTQKQFGEELGVSRQQIWNLEHGKNHLTKLHYLAIQCIFHQKEELVGWKAKEEPELWRKFTLAKMVYDFIIMSPELFNDEREQEEITRMLYTAGPLYLRAKNDNERERITEDFCESAAILGYDDFYEDMKKI